MVRTLVILPCLLGFSVLAFAQSESITNDRYLKACLFSASEKLPKAPGMVIDSATGKVDRQGGDGAIVTATFEVRAFDVKATYRFLCGYKGTQVVPIQGIFVE